MKAILKRSLDFIPKDGRWFLGGSHLFLCLISIIFFNFQRSWFQIIVAYLTAITVELVLFKTTSKYKDKKASDRIFSASTEVAGLLILIKSGHPYFYAITGSIAVISKYLFRLNKLQHLYNPTNFAIVMGLLLFPATSFNVLGDEFTLSVYPLFHVLIIGTFAIWRGGTWPVSLAYFVTILLNALMMKFFFHENFYYWFGPEVGVIGLIFIFLMITDPKTTPSSIPNMMLYGFAVAFFKIILKYYEFVYPAYIALMIVIVIRGTSILLNSTVNSPTDEKIDQKNQTLVES